MNSFVRHAFEQVAGIDDKVSDARTIALALTNACAVDYNAYTEAQACTFQTAKGRNYWRWMRGSDSEKIQASLQIVLMHRAGKLPKG